MTHANEAGLRIAFDHGIDHTRLLAYRSLAQSRCMTLEHVLRAAFRGSCARW
ncbi:MAG: hypothetical protein M3P23_04475 [Actinomycetota bacterium]|nr:hypothetical protein [Actinomycetota bacterium]